MKIKTTESKSIFFFLMWTFFCFILWGLSFSTTKGKLQGDDEREAVIALKASISLERC